MLTPCEARRGLLCKFPDESIGDTEGDRLAAMKAEVGFIHASYGFGRVSESANVKSADSFSKVVEMLLTPSNFIEFV